MLEGRREDMNLIAVGCQQYRICYSDKCPVGVTTHDPELRARFNVDLSVKRFVNYYQATKEELCHLARANGRSNIHDFDLFDLSDIFTISNDISQNTEISHC